MAELILKPGREKSVLRRHPWLFPGAIQKVTGNPGVGDTVLIRSAKGAPLARAAYSPESQIRARIWTFDPDQAVDADFFKNRIDRAVASRIRVAGDSTGYRVIGAESDGLPGLVVDRYGDFLVCQFLSAGPEALKETIVGALGSAIPVAGIYERSDTSARVKEGLSPVTGRIRGEEPPDRIEITEGPIRFLVDVRTGHKTGYYLDQRDNRRILMEYAKDREVLNCFAYTGGFGLFALSGGAASVTNVDVSQSALDLAAEHVILNGLDPSRSIQMKADVFHQLRTFRDSARTFDIVVLDPPKFAESASQVAKASRGYKDINLLGIKLTRPGGFVFTFSCSGHMTSERFRQVIAGAALDSGRDVRLVKPLYQAPDHPVALGFPEGEYLKGMILQVW